ncbi:hypothetical protein [Lactococcus lactis]|uniref:hypothetical protein n=1 Tax=Lactococcus lactis TaxID=1358 RepID=UPI000BFA3D15|nr:hypothetical protein [Lactococcus lactis]PFG82695.1 hypothetical protein BW151_03435 [Lactococcus lactis]
MVESFHDMLAEVEEILLKDQDIQVIKAAKGLKSYQRPESLPDNQTSIIIDPLGPPEEAVKGSNTSLSNKFIYQINVESTDRIECKKLQSKIKTLLNEFGFTQTSGGLDEYFDTTKRYVDARRYIGYSKLYENY